MKRQSLDLIQIIGLATAITLPVLMGCSSGVDPDYEPPSTAIHPFESTSDHGAYLVENGYAFAQCTPCHGDDLAGSPTGEEGTTVRSCYTCHRSDNHIVSFADAAQAHPGYLRDNLWDLEPCYICHAPATESSGIDFGGSCSSGGCHQGQAGGPKACNTCHGSMSGNPQDQVNWAPPPALYGATETSNRGVGAHRAHLSAPRDFAAPVPCSACHNVPSAWDSRGHIDDSPDMATIFWGSPANARGADPTYDYTSYTCSNTHCHGGSDPVWTDDDGSWGGCGSCHSLPPQAPHAPATLGECAECHGTVISGTGSIIGPELHVNGTVDLDFDG